MKKFFAILMSLALMLSLAVPAMAANVTIPSALTSHTFTVYQIFSGREENGVLSDIAWGTGINKDDFFKRFGEIELCIEDAIKSMNYSKINVFY